MSKMIIITSRKILNLSKEISSTEISIKIEPNHHIFKEITQRISHKSHPIKNQFTKRSNHLLFKSDKNKILNPQKHLSDLIIALKM